MLPDLPDLTPDSTLADLPSYSFQVNLSELGGVVAQRFEQDPDLPGVVILNGTRIVGMISRQRFLEQMSQPHSLQLYLNRPLSALLGVMKAEYSSFPERCKIDEAAHKALERSEETVYDPIVILQRKRPRLIDMHILLLAQSQILHQANQIAEQQKHESQALLDLLQQEKARRQDYAKMLETQQQELSQHNHLLEAQGSELATQSEEIARFNQRFLQISQLLSLEGHRAFRSTRQAMEAIRQNTEYLSETNKALARELDTVKTASDLIGRVSSQAQFLAKQTEAFTDDAAGGMADFERISKDIHDLVTQSYEAGTKLNKTFRHFRDQVGCLKELAQQRSTTAQDLHKRLFRAETALNDLERLVRRLDLYQALDDPLLSEFDPEESAVATVASTNEVAQINLPKISDRALTPEVAEYDLTLPNAADDVDQEVDQVNDRTLDDRNFADQLPAPPPNLLQRFNSKNLAKPAQPSQKDQNRGQNSKSGASPKRKKPDRSRSLVKASLADLKSSQGDDRHHRNGHQNPNPPNLNGRGKFDPIPDPWE